MSNLRNIFDSVNGRIVQCWLLVLVGLVGYSQPSWFPVPEQVSAVVFGLGIGVLTGSLAKANDGK
jgi:hypothetical protein